MYARRGAQMGGGRRCLQDPTPSVPRWICHLHGRCVAGPANESGFCGRARLRGAAHNNGCLDRGLCISGAFKPGMRWHVVQNSTHVRFAERDMQLSKMRWVAGKEHKSRAWPVVCRGPAAGGKGSTACFKGRTFRYRTARGACCVNLDRRLRKRHSRSVVLSGCMAWLRPGLQPSCSPKRSPGRNKGQAVGSNAFQG